MKESISSTWILQLVIIFILMFVSFLILTLTYSKSYKTKNEVINIIEKYEGVNDKSIPIINGYLNQAGYRATHACPDPKESANWIGCPDLSKPNLEKVQKGKKYYYCIRKHDNSKEITKKAAGYNAGNINSTMYYEIKIFYKFSLPILDNIATFTTDGTTNDIFKNDDIFKKLKVGSV